MAAARRSELPRRFSAVILIPTTPTSALAKSKISIAFYSKQEMKLNQNIILILSIFIGLSTSNCRNAEENFVKENEELKDSILILKQNLKSYENLLSFEGIKPMIIPIDTNFQTGKKSIFKIVVAARELKRKNLNFPLSFDFNSNVESEMWMEEKNSDHYLTYLPKNGGNDTIEVFFHYQDPDSAESIRIPAKFPIVVKD